MPSNNLLKKVNDMVNSTNKQKILEKNRVESERKNFILGIGKDIISALKPTLEMIARSSASNMKAMQNSINSIKIPQPQINVDVPDIKVPKPEVNVRVPDIKIPDLNMPKEMDIKGFIGLMGYDRGLLSDPLPVQLRDASGNPIDLLKNLTTIVSGGGGGGKTDHFTIKGFGQSAFAEFMNPDGRVKVEMPAGGSGLTDIELRASSVPVAQASGAVWSTEVTGQFGTTYSDDSMINGDNRLRVSLETGGSGLTDLELRASSVPVAQASGASWSVSVNDMFRTTVASNLINADDRLRVSLETGGSGLTDNELRASSVPVAQASGASWSTLVMGSFGTLFTTDDMVNSDNRLRVSLETGGSGLTDAELRASRLDVLQVSGSVDSVVVNNVLSSVSATIIDSSGVGYSGSNPVPVSGTVAVSGITASVGATILDGDGLMKETWVISDITASAKCALIDSTGEQYSGSNPVPISGAVTVNGALNSILATGVTLHDVADDGDAPLKVGGVAMQTNPTAVADGDRVRFTADDLGRQITRPVQVRDLIKTAYVALATGSAFGTETTLLASGATAFLDLIYMMGTNDSDASVDIDFRASTGGTVCKTLTIPSGGTAGVSLQIPYPAPFADHTWTIDAPDISGTNVTITALFSKEV